jgi:hypothetical protein
LNGFNDYSLMGIPPPLHPQLGFTSSSVQAVNVAVARVTTSRR